MYGGSKDAHDKIRPHLDVDEQMHWSGQPYQGLSFSRHDVFLIPFILMGLFITVGRHWYDRMRRGYTYYGITNERILIVHGIVRQRITSHDMGSLPALSVEENVDGTGTIRFGSSSDRMPEIMQYQMGMFSGMMDKTDRLEQVDDAREVFKTIKEIREE